VAAWDGEDRPLDLRRGIRRCDARVKMSSICLDDGQIAYESGHLPDDFVFYGLVQRIGKHRDISGSYSI
jgi:hypothetical protein